MWWWDGLEGFVGVDGCWLCDALWMRFTSKQHFDQQPTEVLEVLIDETFWRGVDNLTTMSTPSVLGVDREGDRVTTRLRYNLVVDLPGEAARFIDTSAVSWVEVTEWNLSRTTSETTFVPDQAARLLGASVQTRLHGTARGTVRDISGEVKVRIPIIGSRVESAIIDGVEQYLTEISAAVDAHVSAMPRPDGRFE